jgi:hypothetical protein
VAAPHLHNSDRRRHQIIRSWRFVAATDDPAGRQTCTAIN